MKIQKWVVVLFIFNLVGSALIGEWSGALGWSASLALIAYYELELKTKGAK